MNNQPGTMNNHENRPGTMKNQPGTINNHNNRPNTIKTDLELIKTVKNYENPPGGRNKQKRYKHTLHHNTYIIIIIVIVTRPKPARPGGRDSGAMI